MSSNRQFGLHSPRPFISLILIVVGYVTCTVSAWGSGKAELTPIVAEKQISPNSTVAFPKPDSHGGAWLEYHGSAIDLVWNEAGQNGNTCLVCHARNDCVSCHNTQRPRDHTNSWRTRTHGFGAGADPQQCLICHRQDTCTSCHNETAPRNHRGNWGIEHCFGCHYATGTVPADSCVVCHRIAPH